MYFETYEKIKLFASLYPEEFESLTQEELDAFRSYCSHDHSNLSYLTKQTKNNTGSSIRSSSAQAPASPAGILNN